MYYNDRRVIPVANPRYVPGGYVQDVKWAEDSSLPQHRLADGKVHPAQRAGFVFTVPVSSLKLRSRQDEAIMHAMARAMVAMTEWAKE